MAEPTPFVYEDDERAEVEPFLPDARTVLDAGCGAGGFARTLRRRYGTDTRLTGLEPHPDGAEAARRGGGYDEVVEGWYPDAVTGRRFDLVVFNDVLEHLLEPWDVLASTRDLLTPDGHVVASIPNIQYLPVLWNLARHARFDYTDTGVLDRTHLRFFTWKTATDLFLRAGYDVVSVTGVNSAFRWEPWSRWRRVERLARSSRWMQVVVVARPSTAAVGSSQGATIRV